MLSHQTPAGHVAHCFFLIGYSICYWNLKWSLICFEIQVITILLFHKCIPPNHKQLIKHIRRANKMCTLPFLCELSMFFVAENFLLLPRGKGQNTGAARVLEVVVTMHRIPPILLNEQTQWDVYVAQGDVTLLSLQRQLSAVTLSASLCATQLLS